MSRTRPTSGHPGAVMDAIVTGVASELALENRLRKPRSGRAIAVGVVGFSVAAALASVMVRRASAPARNAELQRVIAQKADQVAATRPRIHVEIRTEPPTAVLEIDGHEVANPFIRSGASERGPRQITARLPGFDSVQQPVTFDHDHLMVLRLVPTERPVPAVPDLGVTKGAPSSIPVRSGAPPVRETRAPTETTRSGPP